MREINKPVVNIAPDIYNTVISLRDDKTRVIETTNLKETASLGISMGAFESGTEPDLTNSRASR
jgi:hypothetical protein